jgi:hypothetical protein
MRLDSFLLADAATANADGRVYIHGGGITRFDVPGLPFGTPLSIYLRFIVDDDELSSPHEFEIEFTDPTGARVIPLPTLTFQPGEVINLPEGEEQYMQMALQFGQVGFTRAGVHTLVVRCDGKELRRMTLPVAVTEQGGVQQGPIGRGANRAARRRQERGRD